jgi:hypothetical protein
VGDNKAELDKKLNRYTLAQKVFFCDDETKFHHYIWTREHILKDFYRLKVFFFESRVSEKQSDDS